MKRFILPLVITMTLSSCASAGNQALKNETQESLRSALIKGKTTKQDVLNRFGEPHSRTTEDSDEELWVYSMLNSQMSATTFIPVVGMLTGGQSQQTRTLQVTFKGNVVDTWFFSSGSDNVKTGIFN